MRFSFPCSWRLLVGALLASLLVMDDGVAAERTSQRSGRTAARQEGAEAKLAEKNASRLRTARPRSRASRRAGEAQPKELFGMSWFKSLEGARSAAAKSEPQAPGKPIFCFRVLGELAGFM